MLCCIRSKQNSSTLLLTSLLIISELKSVFKIKTITQNIMKTELDTEEQIELLYKCKIGS